MMTAVPDSDYTPLKSKVDSVEKTVMTEDQERKKWKANETQMIQIRSDS